MASLVKQLKADKNRPVKFQLTDARHVERFLKAAHRLKNCEREYRSVYLAPNRTKEEQAAHTKLVNELKVMISVIASTPSK